MSERPPRPAATVVVLRDGPRGPEALLLRRAERGDHNSGAWVFPGGLVDAADHAAAVHAGRFDAAAAATRLRTDAPTALAHWAAAVRECVEECALLFAAPALPVERLQGWRAPLARGERSLAELCAAEGLTLTFGALVYLSHWITPVGRAKRFDTRFFVARAPAGQEPCHDADELVEQRWLRPAEALDAAAGLKLMTPTRRTLEWLRGFDDVESALAWARAQAEVPPILGRVATGSRGERPVAPDEPAWAEIGRLDPAGRGDALYEIRAGHPVRLSQRVIRVTAGNPGAMTGPGTNSYLVGGGPRNTWAVIDPGPDDAGHVEALLAAAPGPIEAILATHTHRDHSPAAQRLRERTGARLLGRLADHAQRQDDSFRPDQPLAGGETLALDGATLQVIHTPGHASNHLCYLLLEERLLFTGDHVMQGSTVVIDPPDGDMAAYLASLRALATLELDWLAPGHGFLIAPPRAAFERLITHRLRREAKVLEALRSLGPAPAEALLARVYDDVPARMHPVALRSLLAHLVKLRAEGAVDERDGRWAAARD
ncbi:MBL fold metallo-hydrolase [Piscinibacter defluvii]|uniref:MBL fold metallo-hydrolase n=1 Tax=Piscinibacter defluvii TaxID=1796922 RepID=UPI001F0C7476|nr:MBL fold metallo-hydrolase [Piscinibacter defluvii]